MNNQSTQQLLQQSQIFDNVVDGRKVVTAAGTAEAFTAQTAQIVMIMAEADNTNPICIGASTVDETAATRRGIPLEAGEGITLPVPGRDMSNLYIDAQTNGEGCTFVAFY